MTKSRIRLFRSQALPAIGAILLAGMAGVAAAQDAAESAIILGATGTPQARAQRSLGSSIATSIGRASDSVATSHPPTRAASRGGSQRARRPKSGGFSIALPADVDPLEFTGAPAYTLGNGSSIRVSGGLRKRPAPQGEQGKPEL